VHKGQAAGSPRHRSTRSKASPKFQSRIGKGNGRPGGILCRCYWCFAASPPVLDPAGERERLDDRLASEISASVGAQAAARAAIGTEAPRLPHDLGRAPRRDSG